MAQERHRAKIFVTRNSFMKDKEMQEADDRVKKMSLELGINYEPQDWGIVNADAYRVEEFIEYFEKNFHELHTTQKFELFELIIASFNEAIIEKLFTVNRQKSLTDFLKKHADNSLYSVILEYWCENTDEDMQIAGFINQTLKP